MPFEFKLPELGENITEAEVAEVLVAEGDVIEAEQSVLELETEKAVVELPAPRAGRVAKIHVRAGETIKIGVVVLTIDDANAEEPAAEVAEADAPVEPTVTATQKPDSAVKPASVAAAPAAVAESETEPADGPPPPAGPATRMLARKLGVDLRKVNGTGPHGPIPQEDVEAFVRTLTSAAPSPGASSGPPTPALPDFSKFGEVERQKLNKLNRTAAEHLSMAWRTIPHVTQHEIADVTDLDAARRQYMTAVGSGAPKITMTAIAVKACAQLLREFPTFNSSFDGQTGELVLKKYVHVGIAVDTEAGLVVPVIRDADDKTLRDIAGEIIALAGKARERKLELKDMQGATFTITNLGGIGGTTFTPIVNWPEVAILGMSRMQKQATLIEGQWRERLMLPLSLSYDHRVINGAVAARFIVRLANVLQSAFALLADS